jgi:hypothetical protein
MKRYLTYSNVVASIALFVALGGSSYAAIKLPKNSVGAKQIRAGAVTSRHVADHSLLARDFKAGQLPAGAPGPKGDTGPPGAPGAPGSATAYARVVVTSSGAVVDAAQSKGVANANVTRVALGVTCFHDLGFTPKSIIVSPDIGSEAGVPIAGGALPPAALVVSACGTGAQAAAATADDTGANKDTSYFVIFQ